MLRDFLLKGLAFHVSVLGETPGQPGALTLSLGGISLSKYSPMIGNFWDDVNPHAPDNEEVPTAAALASEAYLHDISPYFWHF